MIDKIYADTKKEKLSALKERLQNFDYNNLGICSISGYVENIDNRYSTIKEEIIAMLSNIGLDRNTCIFIRDKLLNHWQAVFQHNSTIKDLGSSNKKIAKKELTWPIVIYLSDFEISKVTMLMTTCVDYDLESRVTNYLNQNDICRHERFEFTNKVLKGFNLYKKTYKQQIGASVDADFTKEKWEDYKHEFHALSDNDGQFIEFITKVFMLKIIKDNSNLSKICKEVGL